MQPYSPILTTCSGGITYFPAVVKGDALELVGWPLPEAVSSQLLVPATFDKTRDKERGLEEQNGMGCVKQEGR